MLIAKSAILNLQREFIMHHKEIPNPAFERDNNISGNFPTMTLVWYILVQEKDRKIVS